MGRCTPQSCPCSSNHSTLVGARTMCRYVQHRRQLGHWPEKQVPISADIAYSNYITLVIVTTASSQDLLMRSSLARKLLRQYAVACCAAAHSPVRRMRVLSVQLHQRQQLRHHLRWQQQGGQQQKKLNRLLTLCADAVLWPLKRKRYECM